MLAIELQRQWASAGGVQAERANAGLNANRSTLAAIVCRSLCLEAPRSIRMRRSSAEVPASRFEAAHRNQPLVDEADKELAAVAKDRPASIATRSASSSC